MTLPWHQYMMAVAFILAGSNHFRRPRMYQKIIPPYFPNPKFLNAFSGIAEIVLGIGLCVPSVSEYAAVGIIGLLIAVFPANLFMLTDDVAALGLPKWMRLLRLPLQIVLIIWAYEYTAFVK